MAKANYHIHTTYSDGVSSVKEIVERLKSDGVEYFAVTDHDIVEGNIEATALARQYGINHINGVELSCCFESEAGLNASYVGHILSLGFDFDKMKKALKKLNLQKFESNKKLFDLLIKNGYKLRKEACFKKYLDFGLVVKARRDLAVELTSLEYSSSVNAAFNKILNVPPFFEYAKNLPYIREGIRIIHECGGLAIAAHPFGTARGGKHELKASQVEDYVQKLYEYGVDGIEVYYQLYDNDQIEFLSNLADKYKLLKSVGTDFHGVDYQRIKLDPEYAEAMKKRGRDGLVFDRPDIIVKETITKSLKLQ